MTGLCCDKSAVQTFLSVYLVDQHIRRGQLDGIYYTDHNILLHSLHRTSNTNSTNLFLFFIQKRCQERLVIIVSMFLTKAMVGLAQQSVSLSFYFSLTGGLPP